MPLTLKQDELNVLQKEAEYDELDNNEVWFSVFPYDGDIRRKYCDTLEYLLYDYFLICIDVQEELKRDSFILIYATWLLEIANDYYDYVADSVARFEAEFDIDIVVEATEFADTMMDSRETKRFNDYVSGIEGASVPYALKRARNSARIEANKICSRMLHETAKSLYKYHEWCSMEDAKVRPSHAFADGQKILIDEPFKVGDSLMYYPCDMSLGADISEIANCRCYEKFSN